MPSSDLLSLFDAGQRLGLESVDVLRLARNGELGLVEPGFDSDWFGARVTSDSVRIYAAKQDRLRREIDQLEADLRRDEHPSYTPPLVSHIPAAPVSVVGPWRDQIPEPHGEAVIVWVAFAAVFAAAVVLAWWLS